MRLLLFAGVIAVGLTAAFAVPYAPGGAPPPGEQVEHTFNKPMMNGYGVKTLADLRGRPVLVDFWGTHCPPCVGGAVPGSIKLKEEFGDDLSVIFVESQNTPWDETEAFIYRHKWGASNAFWTQEPPCGMDGNGLPAFVLIGSDGRAITAGYPEEGKLRELIEADLKTVKSPPKDMPAALTAAYKDFSKGAFANAIAAVQKLSQESDKAEVAAKAKELATQWTARAESRINRISSLIEHSQFAKADAEAVALKSAVKGVPELETKLAAVTTKLGSDELKLSREAAKALDAALAKVNENRYDEKTVKEMSRLAEKYAATPAGTRAGRLAKLFEAKVDKNSL